MAVEGLTKLNGGFLIHEVPSAAFIWSLGIDDYRIIDNRQMEGGDSVPSSYFMFLI